MLHLCLSDFLSTFSPHFVFVLLELPQVNQQLTANSISIFNNMIQFDVEDTCFAFIQAAIATVLYSLIASDGTGGGCS